MRDKIHRQPERRAEVASAIEHIAAFERDGYRFFVSENDQRRADQLWTRAMNVDELLWRRLRNQMQSYLNEPDWCASCSDEQQQLTVGGELQWHDDGSPWTTSVREVMARRAAWTFAALKWMPHSQSYLWTDRWACIRDAKLSVFPSCALCGEKRNLNVHHSEYTYKPFETFEDLLTLCRGCHKDYHGLLPKPPT